MSRAIRFMFDAIAGRYDRLNGFLSAGRDRVWRRKAARLLPHLDTGARILDLCGGTGDFTRSLRHAGFGSSIVIGDFSLSMLRRSQAKDLRAMAVMMDALHPPFREAVFDAVVCGFGMRNLDHVENGIGAVKTLLKPGGMFVTLEFFRPATAFTRFFYRAVAPVFMPLGGWLLGSKREAYTYLSQSVLGFCRADEYAEFCRAQGFSEVKAVPLDFGIAHAVCAVKGKIDRG